MGRTRGEEKGNGERSTLRGDWRATVRVVVWAGEGKGKKRRVGKAKWDFVNIFFLLPSPSRVRHGHWHWLDWIAGCLLAHPGRLTSVFFSFFFCPSTCQVPCHWGFSGKYLPARCLRCCWPWLAWGCEMVCCLPMQVPLSKMLEGNLAPLHTLITRYMCS
ncbi:hypothetical protein CCHR01_02366 [Colletotrichum chrysophilum]|uniref:Uncharacterized protein n=1 Tax=Colletotrichum chrysophilum TaxID=1836956 RepID=A0AAD9EPJ2_9PEZI|nr:hypothetical protein CCHR01_02366 [Colletotrichum chrysophilum]